MAEFGSDYYGETPAERTARQRRTQANQSNVISDMNETAPEAPNSGFVGGPGSDPWNQGIEDMYQTFLGRQGSAAELATHAGNPGGYAGIQSTIFNSPEAVAHRAPVQQDTPVDPTGNPSAPAAPTSPTAAGGGPPVPNNATDWQSWIQQFMQSTPGGYKAGTLPTTPLPEYTPQNLMSPDMMNSEAMQFGLLQKVLQNPDAYSEENVRQMQESSKEQALAVQKGNIDKLNQRMAAQGRFGSGYGQAQQRRYEDSTLSNILQGNRDVALNAANLNFNSRLNALGSANSTIDSALGRREAQAGEAFKGFSSRSDQTKYALQNALAQESLKQAEAGSGIQNSQLALQAALGAGGLSLDQYKAILGNDLGWYNSMSSNNNFLQNLMAQIGMFNTSQKNNSNG